MVAGQLGSGVFMNSKTMIDAYSEIAPHYEEYSSARLGYLNAVDEQVEKRLSSDMRLLDIGAGDGRRTVKIQTALGLKDIVAVEPSAGMAALCREVIQGKVYEITAEDLSPVEESDFDSALALWNVFGHIPGSAMRLKALQEIFKKLKPGGILMMDINNRHNACAYGLGTVFTRVLVDMLNFNEKRGDASYVWKIGDKEFQASGHLFVASEIEGLFKKAGFHIEERFTLHYLTGSLSKSKYHGQLFYVLKKIRHEI